MYMNHFFDEQKWYEAATTRHDWYKVIYPEFEAILLANEDAGLTRRKESRDAVYGYFEKLLSEDKVILGTHGKNWDEDRKPVDTVVIHHTKGEGGMTWQRLNAMHLLRLYAKSYLNPTTEKEIQDHAVYSNHFRGERPVFYAYHWLIHADGTSERLLADDEIGWQAGNWDINCCSVGICLDGDFEHSQPPEAMLAAARGLIQEHYGHVGAARIIPHKSANPSTTCPGGWYALAKWF